MGVDLKSRFFLSIDECTYRRSTANQVNPTRTFRFFPKAFSGKDTELKSCRVSSQLTEVERICDQWSTE